MNIYVVSSSRGFTHRVEFVESSYDRAVDRANESITKDDGMTAYVLQKWSQKDGAFTLDFTQLPNSETP